MRAFGLMLCLLALLICGRARAAVTGPEARSGVSPGQSGQSQQVASAGVGVLDSVLRGKSRQSRCVRCYEDRDRDRYYGGYSSRTGDDQRTSAWYYSGYDDRSTTRDRDYDRSYDRSRYYDDRYTPRTYDRYEGRGGYDDYRRGSSSGYGSSYGSSAGSYSDRERDRGYGGYESRDRYYPERYSDSSSRDRYYDRSRSSYDRYDPYDRYYSRYDFRNYRPWDETYRGQSGFDNSGRGYYFATDEDDGDSRTRGYGNGNGNGYAYSRPPPSLASPCGRLAGNCPYAGGSKVSSSAIGSDSSRGGGHTSVVGSELPGGKPNGQGGWTYMGDQDKSGGSGSSSSAGGNGGGSGSSGSSGLSSGSSSRDRERERDRDRDAQSSSYGGRPRPLGVSYLLERDSNDPADASSDGPSDPARPAGGGGGVNGEGVPIPAAQTASEGNPGQTVDNAMQ